jgi:hypothetical protein
VHPVLGILGEINGEDAVGLLGHGFLRLLSLFRPMLRNAAPKARLCGVSLAIFIALGYQQRNPTHI